MKKIRHPPILNALLANCKQSDRSIAKAANVSQPTVTRVRQQLEATGIIKKYMAIPNFKKLGFSFGAVTLLKFPPEMPEPLNKIISNNSLILTAPVLSADYNCILISVHKNMEDYVTFISQIRRTHPDNAEINLFATDGLEIKPVRVPTKRGA